MEFDFLLSTSWSRLDIRIASAWADELGERGYDVAIITPSDSKIPSDRARVFRIADLDSGDPVDFREIERRYDIPSLDHLSTTEREYFSLSGDEAAERMRRSVRALERLFETHDVDYCLQGRGGEAHRLLLQYYVEHGGGTAIWHGFGFFDHSFSLTTDLRDEWDTFDIVEYDDIPDQGRAWARDYIETFRQRRKHFTYDGDDGGVGARIRSALRQLADRDQPGRLSRAAYGALGTRLAARLNKRLCLSEQRSRERCERERYVFFPLQYRAESRLTVYAPEHYDQRWAVEYLARVLPDGIRLFVKPHPHHPGEESPRWIRATNRRPGVRILHPDLHSHDAIHGADAVVTINNTVGLEAVLYQKPVVNLGKAFYSHTPGVRHVTDLGALPEALSSAVGERLSDQAAIETVYSLRQTLYDADRGSLDPEEVRASIDGVLEFVDRIGS